ncbi:MAG: 16S rRNA (guanine(527)-N(7))-methyltransferase RsmG [Candidatus Nanopelagicales bacterium]
MKQLQEYQQILSTTGVQWGLIGPRETERLWDRHIDNCLAVTEDTACLPAGANVIDVGSGAGLPGLVWAIARPDLQITLVEPLDRRIRFLQAVIDDLQVKNVRTLRARATDVTLTADRVTARALAKTATLLPWLTPLVADQGRLVLIKGERAEQEVAECASWLRRHRWNSQILLVGDPPRTRVVIVEREDQG